MKHLKGTNSIVSVCECYRPVMLHFESIDALGMQALSEEKSQPLKRLISILYTSLEIV